MLTLSRYKLVRPPETCVYTLIYKTQNYSTIEINLMERYKSAGISERYIKSNYHIIVTSFFQPSSSF